MDEHQQLHEADALLEKFMKMAMQTNHYGKNPECPMCQVVIEGLAYCQKYYNIDVMREQYGEEIDKHIEEVKNNPRKFLFT